MDQPKVTTPDAPINNNPQSVPEGLPVLENKRIVTHTMKEDIARIGGVSTAKTGAEEPPVKPFSEQIPPPPMPPMPSLKDTYQEPMDNSLLERDQPFSLPGEENKEEAPKQFRISIPPAKSNFNAITIILVAVLAVLIAGGGFGYWWFFIKSADTPSETIEEPAPPAPVAPKPIAPPPPPPPEPEPEPIPPPEPITPATTTPPVITPPVATSTVPVATSTPPIAEPALPTSVINTDQTIVIELSGNNILEKSQSASTSAEIIRQIKEKNTKITSYKSVIRYPVKLSLTKEKRFANSQETAQLLGLAMPADFWKSADALELISYKNGNVFRYGFVAGISNKETAKQTAEKWQPTMLDDLKSLYIEKSYVKPTEITFFENSYLDFYKRYVNMPLPDVSLDYAISDKYFIVATSKEMIYAALDKTKTTILK